MNFEKMQEDRLKIRVVDGVSLEPSTAAVPKEFADNFLSDYQFISEVGRGRTFIVFEALCLKSGETRALKLFHNAAGQNAVQIKRLRLACEAACRLSHPSIIALHAFGLGASGAPYVVTDFVSDPTLRQVLDAEGFLSADLSLDYAIQICEALTHAHANDQVHENLTSAKVFIESIDDIGSQVRVGSFGVPLFDEQHRGRRAAPGDDVYALGCILYECLTGRFPELEPILPSKVVSESDIRPELDTVAMWCLDTNPSERYQDCAEVLRNLLLVRQGKPPERPRASIGRKLLSPLVVASGVVLVIIASALIFLAGHQTATVTVAPKPSLTVNIIAPVAVPAIAPRPVTTAPLTPEQARQKYGLNDAPTTGSTGTGPVSKAKIKSAALNGGLVAAAAYESLTPEQKKKAQAAALKGGLKGFSKWHSIDPNTKSALKKSAGSFAGKAMGFWKKLPDQ